MTFLDDLEEIAANVRKTSTLELPVPGSGGKLAVRFRPPPDPDRLTSVVAAYKTSGALSPDEAKQLIVDCCDEILALRDGELVPADPEGGTLRFDAGDDRWGRLGKNATARDCVAKLYNLDVKPLAATGHADVLVDWLQGIDAEIAARVEDEGKADAAEPSSEKPHASN